jgi:hypothetical protein
MKSIVWSLRVLSWVLSAAADALSKSSDNPLLRVVAGAASLAGHLIEGGLLGHDLVQRRIVKLLITYHGFSYCRANAIYQLFDIAGSTLLQGLLEPGDVQVCFETLDACRAGIVGFDARRLDVRATPASMHQTII